MATTFSPTSNRDDVAQRIIDGAERCFYRSGITATGVDALAAEAGVSKRTLYNHFGNKDAVVIAYLERRELRWRERLAGLLEEAGDEPMARLLAYVKGYAQPHGEEDFRGCAFVNAAAELTDESHPALALVRGSIDNVEAGVRDILADAGVSEPDALASQVLLVLEGAVTVAGIRRHEQVFADAAQLLQNLVAPQLPRSP